MKRKFSFLLAMIVVLTNVVFITMPSVSAETSDVIVSDDFETGYTAISSNTAATLESMQELCDMNPWWYSLRANATDTVFNKAEDVVEGRPLIASVVNDGNGNSAMRITYHNEAGIGTNITTPAQANYFVNESGSYEVSFRFYTTGDIQILGIGGKMVDGVASYYMHNILTKTDNVTYMGDTKASSPAGNAGTGISSNTWYKLKLVVNNDLGYYSVEILDKNGASLQRVGGINIEDGCPAIANIRFRATTENSVVYIDDYSVKKVDSEALLYEDDFELYTGFSGTPQYFTAGANLFNFISQFRVQDKNSQFELVSNDTGKYLQLKATKYSGSIYYPANVMYMPWNGHILTKESQALRGKLQLTFSYCVDNSASPGKTSASFRVICADNFDGSNITNLESDNYTMFRVQPFAQSGGVGYGVQKSANDNDGATSYQQINKGTWYDVQLTFDLIGDEVSMVTKEKGTTAELTFVRSTGLYNNGTALESVKGIMFKADEGMVIDIDDVEIKYVDVPVTESPQLSVKVPEVTDFDGNKIVDTKNVNPALSSIKLTFDSPITDDSAKNISLKSASGTEFTDYTTTNVDGVYTMNFTKTLAPNTKFVITVPTTVVSTEGATLTEDYVCEFTTGEGKARMEITALNIDSVSDVANGGYIYARVKYANSTMAKADCLLLVGFYDANNTMLGSSAFSTNISARDMKTSQDVKVTVPAADELDLSKVSRVSVYLWDSFNNIIPYCESIDVQ